MNKVFLTTVLLALITGCASSHIVVGETRPATNPEDVKLYLHPPTKYEEIAVIESTSETSLAITDQGKTNKAIKRLKREAAKLGANGVLLQGTGETQGASVNAGSAHRSGHKSHGASVDVAVTDKSANGIAIYVTEE